MGMYAHKFKMVTCTVEFFGTARLSARIGEVNLELPNLVGIQEIVEQLGDIVPRLVGTVIRKDLSGLMDSQTLNLNGKQFVSTSDKIRLETGDRLLLVSNQPGG